MIVLAIQMMHTFMMGKSFIMMKFYLHMPSLGLTRI
jgi:hypothetical protein